MSIAYSVVNEKPALITHLVEGLPPSLDPFFERALAKDPDERYATALEVAETLAAFVGSSQPARLLGEATEAPVAPVPTPAPAELTRLTESYAETPQDTLAASTPTTSTHAVSQASFWTSGRFRRTIAIGAAVLSVGILAWAVAPHLWNRVGAPLDLDHVPLNEPVFLLAHEPLPIGCDRGDNTRYLWSKNEQRLTIPTGRQTLFQLGTTSRTSFTFDADLQQGTPWSGKFGVFWGYHEDAALNDPDVPNRKFAWFHYLLFAHRIDKGVHETWVHRGHGYLRYNPQGEITGPGANTAESEGVGLLGGRQNVLVEIRNNRLVRARVGNVELKDTVAPTIDPEVQKQPCQGGFGVFSTGEAVTVSNVRFILHSKK